MKKEEFFNKLNKCIQVTYDGNDDNIYYIWNNDIDRLNKFSKILEQKIDFKDIKFNKDTDIYFEQDVKNKYLLCDFDKIWSKIESEYGTNYQEIIELIKGWLKQQKWEQYTQHQLKQKQPPKCKQYTPSQTYFFLPQTNKQKVNIHLEE